MPDVVNAWMQSNWDSTTGLTLLGVQDNVGQRLIVVGGDRSGGNTVTLDGTDSNLVTALGTPIISVVTQPNNDANRRAIWMWEAVIPAGVTQNPVITCEILNTGGTEVMGSVFAYVVDMDAGYVLQDTAQANSEGLLVDFQETGTTGTVAAGDAVTASIAVIRGSATTSWDNSNKTHNNPNNGDWVLEVVAGTGAGQRHLVGGHGDIGTQAAKTYSDRVTVGTSRMVSAAIAVWTANPDGGTGLLTPPGGQLAGTGFVEILATGLMTAPAAQLSGAGDVIVGATGGLTAPAGQLSGAGIEDTEASGELTPGAASLSGTGAVVISASGELTPGAGFLGGAADELPDFIPTLTGSVVVLGLVGTVS